MGTCTHHPERETTMLCMKYQVYLCEDCMTCRDPGLYCKFRQSCPIWFIFTEENRRRKRAGAAAARSGALDSPCNLS